MNLRALRCFVAVAEELGDVLIQVVFHAQLAAEAGHFNLDDVAREVNDKLIRRHPHVFGADKLQTSAQVLVKWEEIKAQEKNNGPATEGKIFKDLPPRLPALMFAEAVWKQRQMRAVQGGRPVDWIVMRNRLSSLAARNKRDMSTVIETLAQRIGFRVTAGLSERVIYRELFLNGLTLLDLKRGGKGPSLTLSHVAARQEVRDLVAALNLPVRAAGSPSDALSRAAPTSTKAAVPKLTS